MKEVIQSIVLMATVIVFTNFPARADLQSAAKKPTKKFSAITARDLEKTLGKKKNQDFQGFEESDHRLLHMRTRVDPPIAELAKPREAHYIERKFE